MAERIGTQARQRNLRTNAKGFTVLGMAHFVANALESPRSVDHSAIIAQEPTFRTPFYINARTHGQRNANPETRQKQKLKFNLSIN